MRHHLFWARQCGILGVYSLIMFALAVGLPAQVQASALFIVPPQGEIIAGTQTRFTLFIHNPEPSAVTTHAYAALNVVLANNSEKQVVEAVPAPVPQGKALTLPASGYAKQEYAFLLPDTMQGSVTLSLETHNAGSVLFNALAPKPDKPDSGQIALGEKRSEFQPFLDNFSPYEPLYFLFGVDPGMEKSKFQFSFKYKLFNAPFSSQKANTFLDGFHIAYTQTSYWDLKSDSKPFDDTSYKPELFYLIPKIELHTSWIKAFGVQGGFQHESNGKGGDESRSTNTIYIKPIMAFSLTDEIYLSLAPRLWFYVGNDNDTNPDLYDYRGYFDLEAKAGFPMGLVLDTHTRWAGKGPSFQADLSYPLSSIFKSRLNLYLHVQYFNGYAERLKEYWKKEEIVRVGFSLCR